MASSSECDGVVGKFPLPSCNLNKNPARLSPDQKQCSPARMPCINEEVYGIPCISCLSTRHEADIAQPYAFRQATECIVHDRKSASTSSACSYAALLNHVMVIQITGVFSRKCLFETT